ncbi:60S ribosomal export protein NMD3 [Mycena sanguinolenta]|uniref:60S ribosomal export protein NMD3 n=1 Tax=Mycena sanguinolenta TaxID=230812 RepID=A0A8H6Y5S9_9AGAR|nr:60S ribosomal export protein NMD3 [Mycena sanguinolenta]
MTEVRHGFDFFSRQRSHAIKMVESLASVVPVRSKSSEQLLSSDTHTDTTNHQFTNSARAMSNTNQLSVCARIGHSLQLLDPMSLQAADISSTAYWRTPFESLATVSDLIEFTVLDVESTGAHGGSRTCRRIPFAQPRRRRWTTTAPAQIYHTRTHLGAILQPGDTALGYHLTNANYNNTNYAALPSDRLPDIVLVKKTYPNRRKKTKPRNWRLRSIGKEAGEDAKKVEEDYEMFLRELEEDPEMRGAVNLYKAPSGDARMGPPPAEGRGGGKGRRKAQFAMDVDAMEEEAPPERVVDVGGMGDDEDEEPEADFPEVRLDELLEGFDEMTLGTGEDEEEV